MTSHLGAIVQRTLVDEGGRTFCGAPREKKSATGGRPNVSRRTLQKERCHRRAAERFAAHLAKRKVPPEGGTTETRRLELGILDLN
jgi:hypothetical protein